MPTIQAWNRNQRKVEDGLKIVVFKWKKCLYSLYRETELYIVIVSYLTLDILVSVLQPHYLFMFSITPTTYSD